jgi:hypothetical protein
MGIDKKGKLKKNPSAIHVYSGLDRRELDDPSYFGYFLLEGRERRWSENLISHRMEKAIADVLSRLHEYKHLAPYGVM